VVVILLHQRALGGESVRHLEVEPVLDEHVVRFVRAFAPPAARRVARRRRPAARKRRAAR
jgi:hypothetical protein